VSTKKSLTEILTCPTFGLNTSLLTMKRKIDTLDGDKDGSSDLRIKRKAGTDETCLSRFRDGLFEASVLEQYRKSYMNSEP
jgi:hypothetical protein